MPSQTGPIPKDPDNSGGGAVFQISQFLKKMDRQVQPNVQASQEIHESEPQPVPAIPKPVQIRDVTPIQLEPITVQGSASTYQQTPAIQRRIEPALPTQRPFFDRSTATSRATQRVPTQRARTRQQSLPHLTLQPRQGPSPTADQTAQERQLLEELHEDELRRINLNLRLDQLRAGISAAETGMQDVRNQVTQFEREVSEQPEVTPTPVGTATQYRFPFPSPEPLVLYRSETPQPVVHPSITSTEKGQSSSSSTDPIIKPAAQQAEVISIGSSPDPSQPSAPTRTSNRRNKGCPPERYHDPNAKMLAVERDKLARDAKTIERIERNERRAQSVVEGGNNSEEGVEKGSAGSTLKEDHAAKAVAAPV
jgi:hypothetical protein